MFEIPQAEIEQYRQDNIGRIFVYAHRDFAKRCTEKLQKKGYKGTVITHMSIIANIDSKGTRIVTLAERMNMTKQSVGEFVQNLESEGYVERAPDSQDKRASLITFTPKGWDFLRVAYEIKQEIEAEYRQKWGDEKYEIVKECLGELV